MVFEKILNKFSDRFNPGRSDTLKTADMRTVANETLDPGMVTTEGSYGFISIQPMEKHTATVIWLHGLGGSPHGMLTCANMLRENAGVEHVKFIFPQAHRMAITGARGASMNSWFDCFSFDYENRDEDEPGLYRAVERINDIVSAEEEEHNIPSSRIIVGGISQGSAVSLLTALTTKRPLAGVFVLAGYIPLRRKTKEVASPLAPTVPIFWGHGRLDFKVKYDFSFQSARALSSDLGIPFHESDKRLTPDDFKEPGSAAGVRFMSYDHLGHWMNSSEMEDLHTWMTALLPKLTPHQV
ncbi:putative phospholipase/Carboxylesterase [Lyophyllum shimeji]|uniref:Acyl-protein thioesterase 1 n=1 Tax=Lyophyllum shimeji TaxID=47721 RepID=A0A9P3PZM7_LYOSH|nr:putative phospholipase/Carboxylesterase [Lyophyllum shimeji]